MSLPTTSGGEPGKGDDLVRLLQPLLRDEGIRERFVAEAADPAAVKEHLERLLPIEPAAPPEPADVDATRAAETLDDVIATPRPPKPALPARRARARKRPRGQPVEPIQLPNLPGPDDIEPPEEDDDHN